MLRKTATRWILVLPVASVQCDAAPADDDTTDAGQADAGDTCQMPKPPRVSACARFESPAWPDTDTIEGTVEEIVRGPGDDCSGLGGGAWRKDGEQI